MLAARKQACLSIPVPPLWTGIGPLSASRTVIDFLEGVVASCPWFWFRHVMRRHVRQTPCSAPLLPLDNSLFIFVECGCFLTSAQYDAKTDGKVRIRSFAVA